MVFFGLGGLFYVAVLLINAIAILSEDRFLARIGWTASAEPAGFGGPRDDASVKARLINLVSSVRTVMRIPLIPINFLMIMYLLVLG
ncbi:Yos1-like protein [Dothidotthia symphoricarpi CBS 119687]|uniref:Yos1-like protein n=1 Tax=Dothidotthia symphoricarpi CBS 119687 TaxID=1392245 RepID=A0A6A6AP26_9PLEO|nr:Yos1-like protein [Dothidotthia symphoricarpi CBS 119687]KAF2132805.1 Yos1-like protein [Dothidotthia symphoricarpi CBS 119687]